MPLINFLRDREFDEKLHLILFVIMGPNDNQSDNNAQDIIEGRCRKIANVTAIVHKMSYVRPLLEKGHPFFSAVVKQGLCLYDAGLPMPSGLLACDDALVWLTPEQSWKKWGASAHTFLLCAEFF